MSRKRRSKSKAAKVRMNPLFAYPYGKSAMAMWFNQRLKGAKWVAPGTYKIKLTDLTDGASGTTADFVIVDEVEDKPTKPDVVWYDESSNIKMADFKTASDVVWPDVDYSKLENRILAWDLATNTPRDGVYRQFIEYYGGTVTGRWSSRDVEAENNKPKGRSMSHIDSVGVVFNQPIHLSHSNWSRKTYWYKTNIPGICKGDTVVIDSAGSGNLATATVVEVYRNTVVDYAVKWVVDKVDTESYKAAQLAEHERQQRKVALQNRIDILQTRMKERERTIRDDLVRKALLKDDQYGALVGDLQDLAQQLRDLG